MKILKKIMGFLFWLGVLFGLIYIVADDAYETTQTIIPTPTPLATVSVYDEESGSVFKWFKYRKLLKEYEKEYVKFFEEVNRQLYDENFHIEYNLYSNYFLLEVYPKTTLDESLIENPLYSKEFYETYTEEFIDMYINKINKMEYVDGDEYFFVSKYKKIKVCFSDYFKVQKYDFKTTKICFKSVEFKLDYLDDKESFIVDYVDAWSYHNLVIDQPTKNYHHYEEKIDYDYHAEQYDDFYDFYLDWEDSFEDEDEARIYWEYYH